MHGEAKSCSLTHTLICKALQAGRCWDDIRDILHLTFCNANIHTYTSCFMEIQQMDNETLAAYVYHFKTEAKRCDFNSDTSMIHIFVKDLWDAHNTLTKTHGKDPLTLLEVIKLVENLKMAQQVTATFTFHTVNMMSNDDRYFVCS